MEEMGIIRRLDALGRIVIPREFRKLNRIEVGDPLEMRALSGGEILVKKVDLSAQLKSVGQIAIAALNEKLDYSFAICSPEGWLLASGGKNNLSGEELGPEVMQAVQALKSTTLKCEDANVKSKNKLVTFFPIIGETGSFGAIAAFTDEPITAEHKALIDTVARFTGATMQNF